MTARSRPARLARLLAATLTLPALLLALWWYATRSSENFYVPPLADIAAAFVRTWTLEGIRRDVVPSLVRLLEGLAIAGVLGVALGVLLGRHPLARAFAEPALAFFRALPAPAIIPALLLVFGIGDATKVVVIALGCLWPVLLNTLDGVRGLDPVQDETIRLYRITGRRRLGIILRAASPQIAVGARQALALGIILMVVSEMLMSTNGLGHAVVRFERSFAIPEMWSGVVLIGILGFVLSRIHLAIEHRVLSWHRGMTHQEVAP